MRKLSILIVFICLALFSVAQKMPTETWVGNLKTETYDSGMRGAYYGIHFRKNFTDTSEANIITNGVNLKSIAGLVIQANDTLWKRNKTATRWDKIGSGSSNNPYLECYKLIKGGIVSWAGTGFVFDVSPTDYIINCKLYHSGQTPKTLAASNPTFDRLDVVAVDTNSNVVVITGIPSATPVVPQADIASQLALTTILVKAGSSTPTGVTQTIVYDENIEWTSSVIGGSGTVDFNSTITPFHLVKNALSTGECHLSWQAPTTEYVYNYSLLKIYVKISSTTPSPSLAVGIADGLNASNKLVMQDYGLNPLLYDVYQVVTIPMSSFIGIGSTFNQVNVFVMDSSLVNVDYVQLQSGIPTGNSPYITDVYRATGTDSVFVVKNGVSQFAYIDSTGGGGGGNDTIQLTPPLYCLYDTVTGQQTVFSTKASHTDSGYVDTLQVHNWDSAYNVILNGGGSGGIDNPWTVDYNAAQHKLDSLGSIRVGVYSGTPGTTTYTTYDPAFLEPDLILSNGNLTVTSSNSVYGITRSIDSTAVGDSVVWETVITTANDEFFIGGIVTSTANRGFQLGEEVSSWGLRADGFLYHNNSYSFGDFPIANGDKITFVFNNTDGTLKFKKNGTLQSPFFTGIPSGNYFAATGARGGSPNSVTTNFGATTITYPVTGYKDGIYETSGSGVTYTNILKTDSASKVTTINLVDSLTFINNTSLRTSPTNIKTLGNSLSGISYCTPDSLYARQLATGLGEGINLVNYQVNGSCVFSMQTLGYAHINPNHTSMETMMPGFNNLRYDSSLLMCRNVLNTMSANFLNHFAETSTPAFDLSVINSGSWSTYPANTVGGKYPNGASTTTSGDYLEWKFYGTRFGIGLIAFDSTLYLGARFKVFDNGNLLGTFTENSQTNGVSDGTNDNGRTAMAIMFGGLTDTQHIIRVVSDQSTNTLAVDYFAKLSDVGMYPPLIWIKPPYMNVAGYAIIPNKGSVYSNNRLSTKIDSLATQLSSFGLPLYVANTNAYVDTLTDIQGDNIHLNDEGQRHVYQSILAVLPSSPIFRNNTLLANNGLFYTLNGQVKKIAFLDDLPSASGTDFIQNQDKFIQVGKFKINGESTIANTLTLGLPTTNQFPLKMKMGSNRNVNFYANSGSNDMESVNDARTDGVQMNYIASGYQWNKRVSSISTVLAQLDADRTFTAGAINSTGATSTYQAGVGLQYQGGDGYVDGYNGSSWNNIKIRGLDVVMMNSGVSAFTLSGGAAKLNTYGSGTHTGTAAYGLQVDASGNIIEGSVSSGLTSANFVYGEAFTGSASSTYTLANTPVTGKVSVFKNGIRIQEGIDYTISGTTVTLLFSRVSGDRFLNDYIK